ncbi:MAG: pyruvate formate-lyase-activating protein, partial [Ignavibacteriales bacterium]
QTEGYIHSIETCGTLDGPGVRYVVFMQGCNTGCAFCHNPDTWKMSIGQLTSVDWLVEDILKYLPFYRSSGGGVTISGGEPLLQADFLTVLFRRLGVHGIHRTIDTSGFFAVNKVKPLLVETDLVQLSIKHADPAKHHQLTGKAPDLPYEFARYLTEINKPVWLRYVIIPGVSDSPEDLQLLADLIGSLSNVERVELLPYNDLGVQKWNELGLEYGMPGLQPPGPEQMLESSRYLSRLLPDIKILCG